MDATRSAGGTQRVMAVVQARLGSSRFPGKVLADLDGRSVLEVLLHRLSAAERIDGILVAIPDLPEDDRLAEEVSAWGFTVTRGPAGDVLSRFVSALEGRGADVVVRITGDCPLVDPALVDQVVTTLLADPALDYVALGETFPDGADCEAFRVSALALADIEAVRPSEREHVTPWLRDHPSRCRALLLTQDPDDGDVRLTVDEPVDLDVLRVLVGRLGAEPSTGMDSYVAALRDAPELLARRIGMTRNEGLWRSRNLDDLEHIGLHHGRQRSDELLVRARRLIPSATQTLSKGPDQFVEGVTPTFLESGSGCHVTDVDGNIFIDYPMALGPIILGYNHPRTVEAVRRQMERGTTFTLPHRLEVEVAEQVVDMVPCAEMVRFAKNGSDVTDAAVRLARAVTGRNTVLACGYHGWHDWYVVQTARNAGVPDVLAAFIEMFPFNDLDAFQAAVDRHADNLAAVILEIGFDDPHDGYLAALRDRTHAAGGVLIFDEIVTGFRWARGGAQEHYGVTPDLACFGKAMANGLPLAAVVGRRDLMLEFDRVFFSGTFGGETLSLAAAQVTMAEIADAPVIEHIWSEGKRLHSGIREAIVRSGLDIEVIGQPPRGGILFCRNGEDAPEVRGLFLQETVKRGVLFGGPVFVTYAHDRKDIDRTIEIVDDALQVVRRAVETDTVEDALEGPPPGVVFRLARN